LQPKSGSAGVSPAFPNDKESTYVKEYREPARRPRSMTLDTLADVMRSRRQGEVVEQMTEG
jgi:hypothetical protein